MRKIYIFSRQASYLSRFWVLVGLLILSLALGLTGVALTRLTHDDGCLIYDPGPGYYLSMFDLRSGQHAFSSVISSKSDPFMRYENNGPVTLDSAKMYPYKGYYNSHFGPVTLRKVSPTGHFVAVLDSGRSSRSAFSLSVVDSNGARTKFAEIVIIYDFAWTSEDKMVYQNWANEIVEADPQTGEKRSAMLPYDSGEQTQFALSPSGLLLARWDRRGTVTVIPTSELLDSKTALPARWATFRLNKREAWIRWSPNSNYFAVMYSAPGGGGGRVGDSTPLDILTIDGQTFRNVATLTMRRAPGGETFLDARWSADGKFLLYRDPELNSPLSDLLAFDPQTGRRQIIEQKVIGTLAFSFETTPYYDLGNPALERIALVREDGDHYVVELMDISGQTRSVPVPDATWVGNLLWLSDGQTIVIPWATGQMPHRRVHISLVSSNGQTLWDVNDNDQNISQMVWLRSPPIGNPPQTNDRLLYIAQQSNLYSVNILDLNTGKNRRLADGFDQLAGMAWDQSAQAVSFWWHLPHDLYGTDQYRTDGTRVYRFLAAGTVNEGGKVYPSPDGKSAILEVRNRGSVSLQYASSDRAIARVVDPMRREPDEVIWSIDDKLLAVFDDLGIEVLGIDGHRRWIATRADSNLRWNGSGLSFGRCLPVYHP